MRLLFQSAHSQESPKFILTIESFLLKLSLSHPNFLEIGSDYINQFLLHFLFISQNFSSSISIFQKSLCLALTLSTTNKFQLDKSLISSALNSLLSLFNPSQLLIWIFPVISNFSLHDQDFLAKLFVHLQN
jgi:hypothetical protein